MDEIVLSVRKVTAIMASISTASAEQEHGIGQVTTAIGEMDGVTQQNAALVEEAAAAAAAMQAQAKELAQLVGSFKIDPTSVKTPTPTKPSTPRIHVGRISAA